jgi:hypothetical protein
MRLLAIGVLLAVASTACMAFEEQKMAPGGSAAGGAAPAVGAAPSMGRLGITTPELTVPKTDSGTKIRVPGLGVIGEIPKMDFGLELLYGASQNKMDADRNEASGVMLRSKIPLGSPR